MSYPEVLNGRVPTRNHEDASTETNERAMDGKYLLDRENEHEPPETDEYAYDNPGEGELDFNE